MWSQVGRLTLIKTVLSSLPVYPFSNFKVHHAICKDIDRRIWNFFSEVIMKGSGKLFIKLERLWGWGGGVGEGCWRGMVGVRM